MHEIAKYFQKNNTGTTKTKSKAIAAIFACFDENVFENSSFTKTYLIVFDTAIKKTNTHFMENKLPEKQVNRLTIKYIKKI